MAKPPKPEAGASRRERLASFEAARKSEQRRRSMGLLAICVVLALALLAYPVYLFVQDHNARNATLADFGTDLAGAGCSAPAENTATGNQNHVPDGTRVTYDRLPPDSGPHYGTPAPFTKHFYAGDRPAVETLVHNLEHGYTVAWYRADAPSDQISALQDIAKTFSGDNDDLANKFIAAPWTDPGFPAGKNVVLTHWYADPSDPTNTGKQKGIRQECAAVSGAAIADFMETYPAADSPEPNGA
ncbi:MAG: DUF3105 domain-containing protein [Friedmanniella sp.]